MRHSSERDRWVLDAIERHDDALEAFDRALAEAPLRSRGLLGVREHVASLVAAPAFRARRAETAATRAAREEVAVRLWIGQQRIVVSRVRDEPDLAGEIRAAFAPIREGEPAPLPVDTFSTLDMNPLEAQILARVVRLAPEPFARLASVVAAWQPVINPTLAVIAEDAAWFLAVLDLLAPLRAAGLDVSYPDIATDGRLAAAGLFDLALARRLVGAGRPVVRSDIALASHERRVTVTGPSQGGRTSYARAIGQLHVLAAAGCPVSAASAVVPLANAVATVFDRPERLDDPGGRLRTELRRLRILLDGTTPSTLAIANEAFASTTAEDALALSRRLLDAIGERGARVVAVTFIEELAADEGTVSIAATVDADDPTARTYRFERGPADGLAHAQILAAHYGLGAGAVRARIAR